MKVRKLYHAPCRESGMGYLITDIENTSDELHKYQCLHCGKTGICADDDDVESIDIEPKYGDTIALYMVIDRYRITVENEEQAEKFADMYGITKYTLVPQLHLYDDNNTIDYAAILRGEDITTPHDDEEA